MFFFSVSALVTGCFGTNNNLPPLSKYGRVTGTVVNGAVGDPVKDVRLLMDVHGTIYSTSTETDGTFSLDTGEITRGEGFTLQVVHSSFASASRAVVFDVVNLRVDLGTISLVETGSAPEETRTVTGQIVDYNGAAMEGAVISMQNSASPAGTIHGISGADGSFALSGKYLYTGSTYALTVSKTGHITKSNVTVAISGASSVIDDSPVYLFPNHGAITGVVLDDTTGTPLEGAAVSADDELGSTISALTDSEGKFRLESEHFYIESTYSVSVTKELYRTGSVTAAIDSLDDNSITGGSLELLIDSSITGSVTDTGGVPVAGVMVSVTDSSETSVSGISNSSGFFVITGEHFRKNQVYTLSFTHDDYETRSLDTDAVAPGVNNTGTIVLVEKSYDYILTGTVEDAWDIGAKVAASVTITDDYGVERTASCDAGTGVFSVGGYFLKEKTYNLAVSCSGYTGSMSVTGESLGITITGEMPQSEPQAVGTILLYPIGIRTRIQGTKHEFSSDLKESREKFLTGKHGFTLSGRSSSERNSYSSFYIHTDDADQVPAPPGGGRSVALRINGTSEGSLVNGLAGEESSRTAVQKPSVFKIRTYSMFHFKITDPGSVTVETTGDIDTSLILYFENGSQLAADDNSGPGSNGSITFNTGATGPGWYFVKVSGASDSVWGTFGLSVSGPEQTDGITGTWMLDDIILSWYSNTDRVMYIAGKNESSSAGTITIDTMENTGGLVRGSFSGTMRAITSGGATVTATDGYFNIIRSQ